MGSERTAAAAAPAAPVPEAAPSSAAVVAGCVMSWRRSSAGAWRSCVGLGCNGWRGGWQVNDQKGRERRPKQWAKGYIGVKRGARGHRETRENEEMLNMT